ncbi:MAG TPA: MoaD/ThiS family protein [Luteolibacter sp.]|nr:MoaD/ThiS family protein [Luteolibacter sp.]
MIYRVLYFGLLAERRGFAEETVESSARTPARLYAELDAKHGLGLSVADFRVAVNDEFATWDVEIKSGDAIALLPPMSGG